jgi:hypothetical protein
MARLLKSETHLLRKGVSNRSLRSGKLSAKPSSIRTRSTLGRRPKTPQVALMVDDETSSEEEDPETSRLEDQLTDEKLKKLQEIFQVGGGKEA